MGKDVDGLLEIYGQSMIDNAFNRCQPNVVERVGEALIHGADPEAIRISSSQPKPHLIEALNKGEAHLVAMLLAAGASLDREHGGITPRRIIAGNLSDYERDKGNGRETTSPFPRVANAPAVARLATPEGLREWIESDPLCAQVAEAAKTPRLARLKARHDDWK